MCAIGTDYRTSSGKLAYEDVRERKINLEQLIHQEHPRQKITYNAISNKLSSYYVEFCEIYNNRCAYCGVPVGIIDSQMFEIDHFKCESSYPSTTEGRSAAGKINNLVFSCRNCNRGKKDLIIENRYKKLLNPDDNSITRVFYRSEDYSIRIVDEYKDNRIICNFYKQLNLGSQLKRLDFLLLSLRDMAEDNFVDSNFSQQLEVCFSLLLRKRNTLSYKLSKVKS